MPSKSFERDLIRGWLHEPAFTVQGAIGLTHGAGSNAQAPLLKALAEEFAAAGWVVLRYDLPYRQQRPHGPPFPAQAARDREGIRRAAQALREIVGRVCLGGHSYGGRQTTMAVAEDPSLAEALLVLSYPLHPPGKPDQVRTAHFGNLRTPGLFAHGTRDPFGETGELEAALRLIPARTELLSVTGAPHGLPPAVAKNVTARFVEFIAR